MNNSIVKQTFTDKNFLHTTVSIALPMMLQEMLSTGTNMVDTLMIGPLGTATISAVGLANKYYFIFYAIIFGVGSGAGVLIAQFFGNNDHYHIRKTFGLGLTINLLTAAAFSLLAFLKPSFVLRLFTNSPEVVEIGAGYIRIASFSYPIFAGTVLLSHTLRSVRQVRSPVIASFISLMVKVIINYALIYGHLGSRALGVEGVAAATIAARLVELAILCCFSFAKGEVLKGKISDFLGWTGAFLRNFCVYSLPVIFNETIWVFGTTLYYVAYGHISVGAVAAITISSSITDIITILGTGLSAAAAVILGNELGAGKMEESDDHSKKLLLLGFAAGLLGAAVTFLLRNPLLSLFDVDGSVRRDAMLCMIIYLMILPFINDSRIIVVGILRAGGDTRAGMVIDTWGVWLLAVPLALLGALRWKLPIYAVYGFVLLEEFVKFFVGFWRYRKKIWLNNLAQKV